MLCLQRFIYSFLFVLLLNIVIYVVNLFANGGIKYNIELFQRYASKRKQTKPNLRATLFQQSLFVIV